MFEHAGKGINELDIEAQQVLEDMYCECRKNGPGGSDATKRAVAASKDFYRSVVIDLLAWELSSANSRRKLEALCERLRIDVGDDATEGWTANASMADVYTKDDMQVSHEGGGLWQLWTDLDPESDGAANDKEMAMRRCSFEAKATKGRG